jgi:hypothetical protein
MPRSIEEGFVRYLRNAGIQLVWSIDYSVHAIDCSRYIIYSPDPLSPMTAAVLARTYGEDHEAAALAFLAANVTPKGKYLPVPQRLNHHQTTH